jgi:hypothetical protein
MVLNTQAVTLYVVELSILLLSSYAIFTAFKIFRYWNFDATTSFQYGLEKKAYLISVIIFCTILIKILLLPYFIFIIDELSNIMPGAMCGAGVVNSNIYGNYVLAIKVFNIFICGLWLILNSLDLKSKTLVFMKKKIFIYFIVFASLILEVVLTTIYFWNLNFETPVSCCSTIFSASSQANSISIDDKYLVILFYLLFILTIFSNIYNYKLVLIISSLLFLFIAINSIINIFSPYVYELPTHKCPFCLLQKDYYYVGYLFFGSLLIGIFLSIYNSILQAIFKVEKSINIQKYSLIFLVIFFISVNFYPVKYYLINKVWLFSIF